MSGADPQVTNPQSQDGRPPIRRLLLVADVAVAGVQHLPPSVRAVIDAANQVHVLTPTLPGRLAWLADDVDGCRHVADERLDTVLDHMHAIGADVTGARRRGSLETVIADAVAAFDPDHVLLALRSSGHAYWQERRLVEHVQERFGLPVTSYAVDAAGLTAPADGPLLLCYDGSEDAQHAIQRAGHLFRGERALIVTVREPVAELGSLAWAATAGVVDGVRGDHHHDAQGEHLADEGAECARDAGLRAEPLAVKATGPVWKTILEIAARHDAAAIVLGSRGLGAVRSMLLGSVSNAIVHHTDRPVLVIRRTDDEPRQTHFSEPSEASAVPEEIGA